MASGVGCQFVTAVDRDLIPGGEGGAGQGGAGQGGGQGGGGQGGSQPPDPCTDGTRNGDETDVDCGGGTCAPCATGMTCGVAGDCASGTCSVAGTCVDVLLISEIRTRGLGGATDEFVELYNPGGAPVTADASWELEVRTAPQNQCGSTTYISRWIGAGETIPAHGHLLIAAEGYTQMPTADVVITGTGVLPDAASVRLMHGTDVADAVCFYFNAQTQGALTCPAAPFTCEGTPIENPHSSDPATDTDESLERLPGGMQGNATDTNDSSADFAVITPATPQSTTSAATP